MASNIDKDTFDLDSLLDKTIDDLADVPEYRPFAAGTHRLNLRLIRSDKKMKDSEKLEPVIIGKLKLIKTEEMADPSEAPMEEGTETQIRFQMDNEYGQGEFKKVASIISAHYKLKSNADVLAVTAENGIEVLAVTGLRTSKQKNQNGEYPKFTFIQDMEVV